VLDVDSGEEYERFHEKGPYRSMAILRQIRSSATSREDVVCC
jgi:hypothetical protein